MKRHFLGACLLLAGSVPCLAIDPIFVRRGPELRPFGATCCSGDGAVAMAADGSFAVYWRRSESGVDSAWVRRLAADGTPLAAAVEVPTGVSLGRNLLSSAPDGSFVLLSTTPTGPVTRMLKVLRFASSGQALPAVDIADTRYADASVGHDGQGNFVVLWSDENTDLRAARFDAAGNLVGSIFEVAQSAGYERIQVVVAADGSFTAFYEKRTDPKTGGHLHRRRYDAAGQPLGAEEAVPPLLMEHFDSQAASAADGFAAAVFALVPHAYGALFDASGAPGPSFTLWDEPNDVTWVPLVAPLANGDFAATVNIAVDNLEQKLVLSRIGRDGLDVGPKMVLSGVPNIGVGALAASGDRILVFAARGADHFLQVYEAPLFADGFESGDSARWVP